MFSEYQHYLRQSETAGLAHNELYLLYLYWGRFGTGSKRELCRALHNPERLADAGESLATRHALAGIAPSVIAESLMELIEEEHQKLVVVNQLIDMLNLRLAELEEGFDVPIDGQPSEQKEDQIAPQEDPQEESELILKVLALAQAQLQARQEVVQLFSKTRSAIIVAIQYGQLLGRFLLKRHCKKQKARMERSNQQSSSISVKL